ncbi:hypothetical protein [Variovorax sp. PMC12]|uniref:hypothetical protein n=1 Tax=Variovorax sp. PMC12 TaxID=2126319 RepID=UPI000D123C3B|nr:hypothetical protein [Variovorax sp. PMC12]AVQ84272.1 hypothetical protein C4F17_26825 [Variovorax sp. PMC12]
MKTIEEIKGRCKITPEGHWLWDGSLRPDGRANIWAPDYTKGGMTVQSGPRAVTHCTTGKPIPNGWRAYGTCDERACCNPDHIACTSDAAFGRWQTKTGVYKGKTTRILANRAIARARSKVTPALIVEIQSSRETGRAIAKRLGIGTTLVSRARRGELKSFASKGVFTGLGAREGACP